MENVKSVLITTVKNKADRNLLKYYQRKTDTEELTFCTGMSVAEPGAKSVLSLIPVDEILVLEEKIPADGDAATAYELKNYQVPDGKTVNDLNAFEFFCYRMGQFMNHRDTEVKKTVAEIPEEKKEKYRTELTKALNCEQEECFYAAAQTDSENTEKLLSQAGLSKDDQDQLSALAYADMDSYYKMHPLKINEDVTCRLLPMQKDENGYISVTVMLNMIKSIMPDKDTELHIHVDLQGLEGTDSHAFWSVINLVSNSADNVKLSSMISTFQEEGRFVATIRNEILRYDIERLLSGMRAFVKYGKVDILEDFVHDHNVKSTTFRKYIAAMKYVDAGLSLCSIQDLEFGINYLRNLFASDDGSDDKETNTSPKERSLLELLKDGIRNDFGELLEGEKLSLPALIKWAYMNQYYQQALTLIEAQIPGDIVERGLFYYARTDEEIDDCLRRWNIEYWTTIPRLRYTFYDPDHYFIKNYGYSLVEGRNSKEKNVREYCQVHIGQLHGEYPELGPAYSELGDEDLLYNILVSYGDLSYVRNIISHAAAELTLKEETDEFIANENLALVREKLEQFLRLYFKACEKIEKNGRNGQTPLIISPQKFKSYTYKNKLQGFKRDNETGALKGDYKVNYNGEEINISILMREAKDSDRPER